MDGIAQEETGEEPGRPEDGRSGTEDPTQTNDLTSRTSGETADNTSGHGSLWLLAGIGAVVFIVAAIMVLRKRRQKEIAEKI